MYFQAFKRTILHEHVTEDLLQRRRGSYMQNESCEKKNSALAENPRTAGFGQSQRKVTRWRERVLMELDRVKALQNPANQPNEILGLYSFAKTTSHLTYSYSEQD